MLGPRGFVSVVGSANAHDELFCYRSSDHKIECLQFHDKQDDSVESFDRLFVCFVTTENVSFKALTTPSWGSLFPPNMKSVVKILLQTTIPASKGENFRKRVIVILHDPRLRTEPVLEIQGLLKSTLFARSDCCGSCVMRERA